MHGYEYVLLDTGREPGDAPAAFLGFRHRVRPARRRGVEDVLLEVLSCAKADAEGGALGDARPGRDVAQPHARVAGDAQRHPGTVGQEAPVRHARKLL